MYPSSNEYYRKQIWKQKYPKIVGALLSIFQMILTMVILGCEIGGDFIHFLRMNIFVGYWTLPLFMCAWISLAAGSCCCRIRCCGITALVFQCLSIPMSLCVIGFDAYFLNNPTLCFFTNCNSYDSSYSYSSYSSYNYYGLSDTDTLYNIKVPLVKGQLAAGVLMLVSSLSYIIIFIITSYLVSKQMQNQTGQSFPVNSYPTSTNYVNPLNVNPVNFPVAPPVYKVPVETPNTSTNVKNQMICPNCRSRFQIAPQYH